MSMDFVTHMSIHVMYLRVIKTHTELMTGMDFVGSTKESAGNLIAQILATRMAVATSMKNNVKN
jgi:hypothetical protein